MARVAWRLEAVQDIDRLRAFLYPKDPHAAQQAAYVIFNGAKHLESSPEMGRPLPDNTKRRELVIPFGASAYILRYIFDNGTVFVLRVWHSRENRSEDTHKTW
jgi:plasmid stabilization system protein ParE